MTTHTTDGAAYAPNQKNPFIVNARCPVHGEAPREETHIAHQEGECIRLLHTMIDTLDIRAQKVADGLLFINGIGKARYATVGERALHRLFGWLPRTV